MSSSSKPESGHHPEQGMAEHRPADEQFRAEVAAWLEANCPPSMRVPAASHEETVWGGRKAVFPSEDARLWMQRAADKRWIAPAWPVQYGGAGLTAAQARIIKQEMKRLHCRVPLMSLGLYMMGPTIMEFGTEEQRLEHLPKIARGEIRWCQGYSEPGAGSDLASLQCKAIDAGDHFVVTGQKVWTSYSDKSDFLFCLVRTDPTAPKHEGISVLLIDMALPGVSARPIELISGASHFCETFLENVRVPKRCLLGELNKGWTIAKRMLQYERSMMSEIDSGGYDPDVIALARRYLGIDGSGRLLEPVLRDQLVVNEMERAAIALTGERIRAEARAGGPSPASSVLKWKMSEQLKQRYELLVTMLGARGIGWEGEGFSEEELHIAREWAFAKIHAIGGGTTEIQLNIIARHVLDLPG